MKKILLKFILICLLPVIFPVSGEILHVHWTAMAGGPGTNVIIADSSENNMQAQPADSAISEKAAADSIRLFETPEGQQGPAGGQPADSVSAEPAVMDTTVSEEIPEGQQRPAGGQPADSAAAESAVMDTTVSKEIPEGQQGPAGVQPADSAAAAAMKPAVYDADWSWLPMGEICFADSVLLYDPGRPGMNTGGEPDSIFTNPDRCLGPPSEVTKDFVSLGSRGTLILQFNDNVVYDGPGPDLYFWIPDSIPEEATVWISRDGVIFLHAGQISSKNPYLDLSGTAEPGEFYTQLKIRDDAIDAVKNGSLGIDLDAVASINNAIVTPIPADSLFSELNLKPEAPRHLKPVVQLINDYPGSVVLIEVYTKNSGAADFNLLLSQQQAKLVRDYLKFKERLMHCQYSAIGLGKQRFFNPHKKMFEDGPMTAIIIFKE
jgi:hypothetical protein